MPTHNSHNLHLLDLFVRNQSPLQLTFMLAYGSHSGSLTWAYGSCTGASTARTRACYVRAKSCTHATYTLIMHAHVRYVRAHVQGATRRIEATRSHLMSFFHPPLSSPNSVVFPQQKCLRRADCGAGSDLATKGPPRGLRLPKFKPRGVSSAELSFAKFGPSIATEY